MAKERGVLERAFLCALGAASRVQRSVEEFLDALEAEGERKKDELASRLREVRREDPVCRLEGSAERFARVLLRRLDVATSSDVEELRRKLERIEELLSHGEEGQPS